MTHPSKAVNRPRLLPFVPSPSGLFPAALLLALLAGLSVLPALTGCQPREIVPHSPLQLLPAERDTVQYRRLVLDNGLNVMLVSNPQTDRSAAALAVGAGSLADPPGRPGMAHFLEHMLFLGTEQYPEPGAYSRYMSSHAGFSNAYTADDHTNYFFTVANEAFEEGLDRFAQFFIAPLFDQAYAEREMNAVDSEHSKNVENDFWRIRQVQREHYRAGHPARHFATGSAETLAGVGNGELRAFYRSHYSSNRMTLAVVGNRSLDALEALVRGRFDRIPDRGLPRPRYPADFLAPKEALRLIRIEPVTDQRMLLLSFPLPPVEQHYRAKPLRLISALLGHEGKGSLLSLLKAEDLAAGLSAGGGESTADYASLEIRVSLTPAGLRRYPEVIARVLGAIEGLSRSGIPRYLFDEYRTMAELEFRFREVDESADEARRLSALMQTHPLEVLPQAASLFLDYEPALYRGLLERLRPDNMLVTLVAKGLPTDRSERYYGARYGYEEQRGPAFAALQREEPDARWHLPEPNPFLPRRVALLEPEGPLKLAGMSLHLLEEDGLPAPLRARLQPLAGMRFTGTEAFLQRMESALEPGERGQWLPLLLKDALPLPVRLLDTPLARVWYLPDWRLRQPKAQLLLKFHQEDAYANPRQVVLARLFEAAWEESLNEVGYPIREAGLGYGLSSGKEGLTLSLSGYSARLLELLDFLTGRLRQIDVSEATFASIKERMARGLENARLQQPYQQSRYFSQMLLQSPNFTNEALAAALAPLTLRDVQAYAAGLFRRSYLEGVVVGNLERDHARAALQRMLARLEVQVLPPARRVEEQVLQIPAGGDWVFSERLPVNNSLAQYHYQVGRSDPTLRGALLIVSRALGDQFYFQMRTQQQLGYIVWAGMGQTRKTLSLNFLVQSGQYPADELLRRMEDYFPDFIRYFKEMPPETFEQLRTAVIQAKLERDKTLGDIAGRLFWVAFEHDGKFDHVSEDIAAVEALTRAQVEAVLERYLRGEGRKRLAIRLIGRGHAAGAPRGEVVRLPPTVLAKAG